MENMIVLHFLSWFYGKGGPSASDYFCCDSLFITLRNYGVW